MQGIGECSLILSGEQIARVADLFGQKFPSLSPGATMSISFFRITPTEIQFIDNRRSRSLSSPGVFGAEFHRERSFSVFGGLPTQTAKTISASLQALNADADTVVARQGGPADKFFIVVDGELEVTREEAGSTETVSTLGPGDLFGEMAILFDKPRGHERAGDQADQAARDGRRDVPLRGRAVAGHHRRTSTRSSGTASARIEHGLARGKGHVRCRRSQARSSARRWGHSPPA